MKAGRCPKQLGVTGRWVSQENGCHRHIFGYHKNMGPDAVAEPVKRRHPMLEMVESKQLLTQLMHVAS